MKFVTWKAKLLLRIIVYLIISSKELKQIGQIYMTSGYMRAYVCTCLYIYFFFFLRKKIIFTFWRIPPV